jgi:hypothetical protein
MLTSPNCSVRHNDLWTLGHSNLNDVVAGPQAGLPIQYVIYGDSAYMHLDESHIRARHNYDPLTAGNPSKTELCRACAKRSNGIMAT